MSRLPRIEVENGVYHVVARGNERRSIFVGVADRECFLEVLAHAAARYRLAVLSYCLMDNHYHLLVRTPNANLARAMRQLNGVYAQSFNRRHGRVGHLFQGRYHARLVQTDAHLATAVRYIARNPVSAGMCMRVDEWCWSSHLRIMGARPAGFLAVRELLSYLADDPRAARAAYLALVTSDHGDGPPPGDHPLIEGDERYTTAHLERLERDPEYPRAALRPRQRPLSELVGAGTDATAIARANREHGYSIRQIAVHLGCGIATVHRRIRGVEISDGTWKT